MYKIGITGSIGTGKTTIANMFALFNIPIFDADPEIRARRRVDQLRLKGEKVDFDIILQALKERDAKDRNRSVAPLVPADDAILVDTSKMGEQQVLNTMLQHIENIK